MAPHVYARSALSLHVPRRQYSNGLSGIPTIRVFEALACGATLICAPWNDVEQLFRAGRRLSWSSTREHEMKAKVRELLRDDAARRQIGANGRETILQRHTCAHRAAAIGRDLRGIESMKLFVFGSSLTSSYWNGAATYYRGIYKNLAELGFQITFAEPDAYGRQQHRDDEDFSYAEVIVYDSPRDIPALLDKRLRRRSGDQAQRRWRRRRCCWSVSVLECRVADNAGGFLGRRCPGDAGQRRRQRAASVSRADSRVRLHLHLRRRPAGGRALRAAGRARLPSGLQRARSQDAPSSSGRSAIGVRPAVCGQSLA